MARRKKGKNARRARQGLLGLTSTLSIRKKKLPKQFTKRDETRKEKKDQKAVIDCLKESAVGGKDTIIDGEKSGPKVPHSFVIHTGKVGRYVRRLEHNLREMMSPHTSKSLKVTKRNNLKDFVVNGHSLGVTHIIVLSRSKLSVNLRIICSNRGPTIHFKVDSFSLCRDVLAMQKRPLIHEGLFKREPLVVLNGFGNDPSKRHLLLTQTAIQSMFPSIDIDTLNLGDVKRVLLVNYNASEDTIDLRHYSIKHVPCDVSKSTKKLLQSKVPDLSKYEDISDFLLNPGVQSDSEFEGEQVELKLPQDIRQRGQLKGQKTKIRLLEIGPRLMLKLTKIEEGVDSGEVLYHSHIHKTTKEIAELRRKAPLLKRKKDRMEKNVQHAVVRRLKASEEKDKRIKDKRAKMEDSLIQQQMETTGDIIAGESDEDEGHKSSASKRFK